MKHFPNNEINLLIVEDDSTFLDLVSKALEIRNSNYKVHSAFNGLEAIEILSDKPIELVLSDINLPVMNGLILLSYVKEHHPGLPFIFMTGNEQTLEAGESNFLSLGADGFISKPFSMSNLYLKTQVILEGQLFKYAA